MNGINSLVNQRKRLSGRAAGIYARRERDVSEKKKATDRKTDLNKEVCRGATDADTSA